MRRATVWPYQRHFPPHISIHALLAESDTIFAVRPYDAPIFLSTLSLRRATFTRHPIPIFTIYFYPRSPCGERPYVLPVPRPPQINFYPRSPCGERLSSYSAKTMSALFLSTLSLRRATVRRLTMADFDKIFLSTLSLRRATPTTKNGSTRSNNFYPRSPCGERHNAGPLPTVCRDFYPRSPCGERRGIIWRDFVGRRFLSTLSLRRATVIISFHPRADLFLSTLSLRRATSLPAAVLALF